jgi:hypothetical protein
MKIYSVVFEPEFEMSQGIVRGLGLVLFGVGTSGCAVLLVNRE